MFTSTRTRSSSSVATSASLAPSTYRNDATRERRRVEIEEEEVADVIESSGEREVSSGTSSGGVTSVTTTSGDAATATGVSDGEMDTKEDSATTTSSPTPPKPSPSPNTVIMFDWDDTLLASSYLAGLGFRLDSPPPSPTQHAEIESAMRALEASVVSLLQLAVQYGHVNVVTNAEHGWVQLSAQKFMPRVVPLLSHPSIHVISARSTFEPAHPDAPLKWKYFAFHERLSTVFGGVSEGSWMSSVSSSRVVTEGVGAGAVANIVSFGDSHVEREAIRAVTRGVGGCRTKSVKFSERSSAEQLRRQVELVSNCFHYIAAHDADLDLQLTVTLNAPPSPSSQPQAPASSPAQPLEVA